MWMCKNLTVKYKNNARGNTHAYTIYRYRCLIGAPFANERTMDFAQSRETFLIQSNRCHYVRTRGNEMRVIYAR